jgi:catechol 2,3-dioxygenase-like lactoylglutathione lyase family enzyme
MKIALTSVYVDDQDKALRFYTEVLGFAKKGRFQQRAISMADRGLTRRAARH